MAGKTFVRNLIPAIILLFLFCSCAQRTSKSGVPNEVESVIGTVTDDIAQQKYDKVYSESASLWKQDATPEQSADILKTLNAKLGKVENRALHSAAEQENSGGPLKGHVFIVTYQTKFELGEAMETFTLLEEDGRWKLARYFVNSTALK